MTPKISIVCGAFVVECWRSLKIAILDTYRPELHYMRGPGPKWHEKHRCHRAA
jgi:hypothetical protein